MYICTAAVNDVTFEYLLVVVWSPDGPMLIAQTSYDDIS